MRKSTLFAAVAALVLWAGTAAAGTVFLPIAYNQTIQGDQYRSVLWATNTGNELAQVKLRFIPNDADGFATVEGPFDDVFTIAPGATVPVGVGYGSIGMLEVTTPSSVHFTSELNAFTPGGRRISTTSVPLIDATNLVPAAETVHLLALERQAGSSLTTFGLVNLHNETTSCQVKAFGADGNQIQTSVSLDVPPLGQRVFQGALGILGVDSIDGARFSATCDDPFYAFGLVTSRQPRSVHFVGPAAGGNQILADTNVQGVVVNRPGQFFRAVNGNSRMEVPIPAPVGESYKRAVIEFDMRTGQIFPVFTATIGFVRPNPAGALYFGHFVRGLNRHGLVRKTILDVDHEVAYQGENGVWLPNATYRVKFDYDAEVGFLTLTVKRGNKVVESLRGRVTNFDLGHTGQGMKLVFGLERFTAEAYYPPTGWSFSNLKVALTP